MLVSLQRIRAAKKTVPFIKYLKIWKNETVKPLGIYSRLFVLVGETQRAGTPPLPSENCGGSNATTVKSKEIMTQLWIFKVAMANKASNQELPSIRKLWFHDNERSSDFFFLLMNYLWTIAGKVKQQSKVWALCHCSRNFCVKKWNLSRFQTTVKAQNCENVAKTPHRLTKELDGVSLKGVNMTGRGSGWGTGGQWVRKQEQNKSVIWNWGREQPLRRD